MTTKDKLQYIHKVINDLNDFDVIGYRTLLVHLEGHKVINNTVKIKLSSLIDRINWGRKANSESILLINLLYGILIKNKDKI